MLQETSESIYLGNNVSTTVEEAINHIPSTIQADTLFTFTTELKYLMQMIENSMISPRYCKEDISYLDISNIKTVAYPMKCFCDINMHRLDEHLAWYGYYGVAFNKAWGMKKGIQPIQYINPDSNLCKDFSIAFTAALKADWEDETEVQHKLKNFLLHEMMYYKPYEGRIKNRNTGNTTKKCFTDECEWRFIPDVTVAGFQQVYYEEKIVNVGVLNELSNSMIGRSDISLTFDYADIKYIILKTTEDFKKFIDEIGGFIESDDVKYQLISKIIIWDNSKGDF